MLSSTFPTLVAHQGGWDEILLVAGPIATIVTLLIIVKRRLDASVNSRSDGDGALDKSAKTD
jgi:hypothetical protein